MSSKSIHRVTIFKFKLKLAIALRDPVGSNRCFSLLIVVVHNRLTARDVVTVDLIELNQRPNLSEAYLGEA